MENAATKAMGESAFQRYTGDIVNKHVLWCLSGLFSTLSESNVLEDEGVGAYWVPPDEDDWEAVCSYEGWHAWQGGDDEEEIKEFKSNPYSLARALDRGGCGFGFKYFMQNADEKTFIYVEVEDGNPVITHVSTDIDSWEALAEQESYTHEGHEVFEHWLVDDWAAHRLRERGQVVLEILDLIVWCRCCTGQSVLLDGVWRDIAREQLEYK